MYIYIYIYVYLYNSLCPSISLLYIYIYIDNRRPTKSHSSAFPQPVRSTVSFHNFKSKI